MEKMDNERRKYVRLPEHCVLKCEKLTTGELFGGTVEQHHIEGVTKNISAGGVLLETKEPFKLGEIIKMEIALPGWEKFKSEFYKTDSVSRSHPLVVLGKVVRVETFGDKYDMGICFVAIDEGHRWAVLKYVSEKNK
ncbi:MAG TPA: PilZ domain-containing protein [Candidatus Omnitrophota bacterium]|nr:PilZ domain-containing protein [Candidatus Omnitrophota bacterium]